MPFLAHSPQSPAMQEWMFAIKHMSLMHCLSTGHDTLHITMPALLVVVSKLQCSSSIEHIVPVALISCRVSAM